MHRPTRITALLLFLACCAAVALGQSSDRVDLRVKILYTNSRAVHNHTQVDLLNATGTLVKRTVTDDSGNAEFPQLEAGGYKIRVSDPAVEENMSDMITLRRFEYAHIEMITVKMKAEAEAEEKQVRAKEAMISALELNVPSGARREFEKGAEALQENRLPDAEKRFLRAIDLYPNYAMAFNHLGVVYMLNGNQAKGREAFERAVALNDHYPSALLNLAKLRYQDGKMQEVEVLLRKATAVDPSSVEILAILSSAELQNGRLDDALANVTKLHAQPHAQFAGIHYLAGQALEAKNRTNEAIAQYTIFLQEAPAGPTSTRAKAALGKLRAQPATRP